MYKNSKNKNTNATEEVKEHKEIIRTAPSMFSFQHYLVSDNRSPVMTQSGH